MANHVIIIHWFWNGRKKKTLTAVSGSSLLIELRKHVGPGGPYVKVRFLDKRKHEDPVDRIVEELHAHRPDAYVRELQNQFWKEWKITFRDETDGVYEKRNIWNIKDATEGKLAEWHSM